MRLAAYFIVALVLFFATFMAFEKYGKSRVDMQSFEECMARNNGQLARKICDDKMATQDVELKKRQSVLDKSKIEKIVVSVFTNSYNGLDTYKVLNTNKDTIITRVTIKSEKGMCSYSANIFPERSITFDDPNGICPNFSFVLVDVYGVTF
jgi:hypothetical protein